MDLILLTLGYIFVNNSWLDGPIWQIQKLAESRQQEDHNRPTLTVMFTRSARLWEQYGMYIIWHCYVLGVCHDGLQITLQIHYCIHIYISNSQYSIYINLYFIFKCSAHFLTILFILYYYRKMSLLLTMLFFIISWPKTWR